jgi:multimeric flavodoxin WrbA
VKVVGIVGSARRGGNTEILTKKALEVIEKEGIKTELISLAGKSVTPCNGCRSCVDTGECPIKDDFDSIFAKMEKADGIILATPVYYGAATPQIVSLISRFYSKDKPLRRKVGGPIVIARRAGHNFTLAQLMFFFMINEMIVPGSTYWNIAFGRQKGDVLKDKEGIATIKNFARNMVWLLKKIHAKPTRHHAP